MTAPAIQSSEALYAELWTSLASLLRSYTAVHGLHANLEAEVAATPHKITVRHGSRQLSLSRDFAHVAWTRENGTMGTLELTEEGTLRGENSEQALDLAAEAWAHDLMKEPRP